MPTTTRVDRFARSVARSVTHGGPLDSVRRFIGGKVGLTHTQVSRLERGLVPTASVRVLARLSQAVGLDLSVRAYPGGDALRDVAQTRLLERLRRHLDPGLRWRTEVPLPMADDKRAWDAVIGGPGWNVAVEAETRLSDVQALTRRLELKRRDGGIEQMILLLADTRTNRSALTVARPALAAAFPQAHGTVIAALARGADPGGSGILIL